MKYALLALIFTCNAFACPNMLRLNSGDSAPCNGYFFNDNSEFKIRQQFHSLEQKNKNQVKALELKDLAIDLKMQESDMWKKESIKQAEVANDRKHDLGKGMALGAGISFLMLILLNQATK